MSSSTTAVNASAAVETDYLPRRQVRLVVIAVLTGVLLGSLDQSVVGLALPRIVSDIGGLSQLAWVVTAYLLTSMAVTPLWGKLSDLYGRRPMYQAAIGVFVASSALAAAAQNMIELIILRAIQGVGAAGLYVLALSIIADVVPPRERGRYQAYFIAVYGISTIGGPLVGGWLTDGPGWRWIFLLNVPLGIASGALVTAVLRHRAQRQRHRIDVAGAALIVGAVTSLLLYLNWAGERFGWFAPGSLALLAGFIAQTALLVVVERRSSEPVIAPRLFANPVFSIGNAFSFLAGAVMFSGIVYLPVFLQVVSGMAPLRAGLAMLPMMVGIGFTTWVSGRVVGRTGRYKLFPIVGSVVLVASLLPMARLTVDTPYWVIAVVGFAFGAGVGCNMQTMIIAVQNSVSPADIGAATSTANLFQRLGASIGTAVYGAVLAGRLTHHLAEQVGPAIPETGPGAVRAEDIEAIRGLAEPLRGQVLEAFARAFDDVFLAGLPFAVLAFVVALFLKELPRDDQAGK